MTERTATCLTCGKPIEQTDGPGRPRLYCSGQCRGRMYQLRMYGFNFAFIAKEHGTMCYLCREDIDLTIKGGMESPCVDHIIPVSAGGRSELANMRVVHWKCNLAKGTNLHCPDCGTSLGTRLLAG